MNDLTFWRHAVVLLRDAGRLRDHRGRRGVRSAATRSTAASRPDRVAAHAAKTATKDCTSAALAPTSPVDER